jgi:glycosyltransferase involved in cell wall biosynthesis
VKILLLAPQPFFQNRGTPIAVRALVEALAAERHQVDLLAYHEGEEIPLPSGTLYRIPGLPGIRGIRPGFSLKKLACDAVMLFRMIPLLRKNRYDLLHAVEESAFLALAARRLFAVPYVYDMDSSLAQQMVEKYPWLRSMKGALEGAERRVVRGSSGVIAVCRSLEETAREHAPGKRVLRLEDISLLEDQGPAESPGASLGVPGPVVMYVGNLERYQGIDLLLESFQVVQREKEPGNLVIVGGRPEDIRHYGDRARDLGISERVFLVGPRPLEMLGACLAQADILVSPRIRGFNTPMKIYSYLDSGKPLLATRLPTHTQVLDDEIALLVAPEPEAMGRGLVRLLRERSLSASLAAAAKRRAREEFTREAYRRKLGSFYREVEEEILGSAPRSALG